eukprot:s898_g13.t1
MLLVILTTLASDGHGLGSGGVAGERWRTALGRAAAVAIPLRAFFEHAENVDMVTAAGICLRCMTYGSEETCAHAARARACPILLSTLRSYADQPATVNSIPTQQEDFQSGLPQTAEVIYHVMEQSSDREPDVLAQGCRAFGSLYATANNEAPQLTLSARSKLNNAIIKTVIGITVNKGDAVEGSAFEVLGSSRQQKLEDTRRRLGELCMHLANGSLASGPQFGRLLSLSGEPTAECTPRWNSLRSRLQERERKKAPAETLPASEGLFGPRNRPAVALKTAEGSAEGDVVPSCSKPPKWAGDGTGEMISPPAGELMCEFETAGSRVLKEWKGRLLGRPAPIANTFLQLHRARLCDPCVFFNSARGCSNGRMCPFCHLDHVKINVAGKNRPRKVTRDKIKERIEGCLQGPKDAVHVCLQEIARDHAYARCLVRGYLDEDEQGDQSDQSEGLDHGFQDEKSRRSLKDVATSKPLLVQFGAAQIFC